MFHFIPSIIIHLIGMRCYCCQTLPLVWELEEAELTSMYGRHRDVSAMIDRDPARRITPGNTYSLYNRRGQVRRTRVGSICSMMNLFAGPRWNHWKQRCVSSRGIPSHVSDGCRSRPSSSSFRLSAMRSPVIVLNAILTIGVSNDYDFHHVPSPYQVAFEYARHNNTKRALLS